MRFQRNDTLNESISLVGKDTVEVDADVLDEILDELADEEMLDELSRLTTLSYQRGANLSRQRRANLALDAMKRNQLHTSASHLKKMKQRDRGIRLANKRLRRRDLTQSEGLEDLADLIEDLDEWEFDALLNELSRPTMKSYLKKRDRQLDKASSKENQAYDRLMKVNRKLRSPIRYGVHTDPDDERRYHKADTKRLKAANKVDRLHRGIRLANRRLGNVDS